MRAANIFLQTIDKLDLLGTKKLKRIKVDLYGSLALTGKGHGTDKAILMGLEGETPNLINVSQIKQRVLNIKKNNILNVNSQYPLAFLYDWDLLFNKQKELDYHSNAMEIEALDFSGNSLYKMDYYSVGGGFVETGLDIRNPNKTNNNTQRRFPFDFNSGKELQ